MNRRNFIKVSAMVGALPLFNIGCAGFGSCRARQIAKGARIRVALIGCGLQTHAMIDGVLCENLVAIVDPDPSRFAWLEKYVADTCSVKYDFLVNKLMDSARGFTLGQLKDAVRICAETDEAMKSSGGDGRDLLKNAVLSIAVESADAKR